MLYQITIHDRNYTCWSTEPPMLSCLQDKTFHPFESKCFSKDIFYFEKNNHTIHLVESKVRSSRPFAAVLILENNQTYGKPNSNKRKFFYKCIPDDLSLPAFLVPYEIKTMGFSKVQKNLYVRIAFVEWIAKHPIGQLDIVYGPVEDLHAFYEYQLACKFLNHEPSLSKFQKHCLDAIMNKKENSDIDVVMNNINKNVSVSPSIFQRMVHEYRPFLEDRTCFTNIFTVDSENTTDFDDALGIQESVCKKYTIVSVYITNVPIWLEFLQQWDHFAKFRRVRTIYLPDKKRALLPALFVEELASLKENELRVALAMDVFYDIDYNIEKIQFKNVCIKVAKNFCFHDPLLKEYLAYQQLVKIMHCSNKEKEVEKVEKEVEKVEKVENLENESYALISFFMRLMNTVSAKELSNAKKGILRVEQPYSNKYILAKHAFQKEKEKEKKEKKDQNIDTDSSNNFTLYCHITSPIRRIVDILNSLVLQASLGLIDSFSVNAWSFYKQWTQKKEKQETTKNVDSNSDSNSDLESDSDSDLDSNYSMIEYLNVTYCAIRKIETNCLLLNLCLQKKGLEKNEFYGEVKIIYNDTNLSVNPYSVFLPELKLKTNVWFTSDQVQHIIQQQEKETKMETIVASQKDTTIIIKKNIKFKLYLFYDEIRFKRKIRLQPIVDML